MVKEIGNAVHDVSQVSELIDEDRKNVANASQDLQCIVDANESVVTRIGRQVILFHDVHSGCRHCRKVAKTRLHEQAEARTILFSPKASFAAATEIEIPLYKK
jgi:hypothetical protein